ncbi:MAG TPA: hypothetical protein PK306_03705 [Aquabacterium sp.]|nr:hypothetical protein [Aquabacterium sp.]HQC94793.1 hypothetical protein [Aquabacterium sp.]
MRRPPGLRAGWLPPQPAAAPPADTATATTPATPGPARAGTTAPAGRAAPGFQATRPFNDFQPTRPFNDFQPTRPVADFQPTRPFADFQPTRPVGDFAPTRPVGDFQPTRPMEPGAARAAVPAQRPPAPQITPPNSEGHWHVRGTPGQNLVLMPGQMHLGQHVASLRTLLGSCVAITLWHPLKRIGGMCHFLLPRRARRAGDAPDGRYGDEAVAEMVRTLSLLRTDPKDYVAHLYGGADTMSGVSAALFNIGERNIEQGWALIEQYGFQLDGIDVGEDIPRTVALNLATGAVTMRRGQGQAPDHLRS